jgi:hypothetical protein
MSLFHVQWVMVEKKTTVEPFLSSTALVELIRRIIYLFHSYIFFYFMFIYFIPGGKNNYSFVYFRVKIISISPCNTQAACRSLEVSMTRFPKRTSVECASGSTWDMSEIWMWEVVSSLSQGAQFLSLMSRS